MRTWLRMNGRNAPHGPSAPCIHGLQNEQEQPAPLPPTRHASLPCCGSRAPPPLPPTIQDLDLLQCPPPSSPHALTLYSWLRIWICCTLEGCSSLMRISWGEVGHLEGGEGGKA